MYIFAVPERDLEESPITYYLFPITIVNNIMYNKWFEANSLFEYHKPHLRKSRSITESKC